MKHIRLTHGLVAEVDDEDYAALSVGGKWHAHHDKNTAYARRRVRRADGDGWVQELMHSVITGWPFVDHINGDGLDNQRANLRPVTSAQNAMNRQVRSDSLSGLKGVRRRRQRDGRWSNRWHAHIHTGGRRVFLGSFPSPEEAARAYDAAALKYFGEYARPNFPVERVA